MNENEKLFDEARSLVFTARSELEQAQDWPHRKETAIRLLTDAYNKMLRLRPPEMADVTRAMHAHAHEMKRLAERIERMAGDRSPQAKEK